MSALKAYLPNRLVGLMRYLNWSKSVAMFQSRIVTHVYVGRKLNVNICDPIAREWYDKECPELEELSTLIAFGSISSKRNVFVLGAHQCVVSLVLSREVGENGTVTAVEGTRFNVDVGRKNILANRASNLKVIHSVVGSQNGTAEFVSVGNGYLGRGKKERTEHVPSVSLDSLASDYGDPDFVLMDIEGAEYSALRECDLLRRRTTTWAIEVHGDCDISNYGGSNRDLFQLFQENGYRIHEYDRKRAYIACGSGDPVTTSRTHICCIPLLQSASI